jgi:hypothetical protein
MKNLYIGQRGSYYATHKVTGEKVLCVWDDLFTELKGRGYSDDDFTAEATDPKFIDARDHLLGATKVLVTLSQRDESGKVILPRVRAGYVGLAAISDVAVNEKALTFTVTKYLERY